MRSKLTILIIGLCLGLAVQAETTITYQGQLQDGDGPISGSPGMEFRFYSDTEGGDLLQELVFSAVEVVDGVFQVELTVDRAVFADLPVYLEVEVAGNVLTPRQSITPTPVAVRALSADDVAFSAGDGLVLTEKTFSLDSDFTDGRYWRQGGNAGIDPATDFLGTTDDTTFEIHVASVRAFRLEPAEIPNVIGGWTGNSVATDVIGTTIGGGGCPDLGTFPCTDNFPNEVTSDFGTIGGGMGNTASGTNATVGGGRMNTASGIIATVGGGHSNSASGTRATVGGGHSNSASTSTATVGGGNGNTASGVGATVGGGGNNTASGGRATVGGGSNNTASGWRATVGGGSSNTASNHQAAVGGGLSNTASGARSTVPGGEANVALGDYSFAAGRRAKAEHDGVFVWADATDLDFASTNADQFLIRAGGGVGINTNDPAGFDLAVNGDVSVGTLQLNTLIGTGSETLCRGTNNFVSECNSSGRYKKEVNTVEDGESRILRLNPVHFSWKETGAEDMGLIAEEVAEVEPRLVNRDESGTVTGVRYRHLTALLISAVQEQAEAMESDRQRLAALEEENAELRQLAERNAELEDRLAALESLLLEDRTVAVGQ